MDFRANPYFNLTVPPQKPLEQLHCGKKSCCKKFKKGKRCKSCPGRAKMA